MAKYRIACSKPRREQFAGPRQRFGKNHVGRPKGQLKQEVTAIRREMSRKKAPAAFINSHNNLNCSVNAGIERIVSNVL
jgi:hypothetical protein